MIVATIQLPYYKFFQKKLQFTITKITLVQITHFHRAIQL